MDVEELLKSLLRDVPDFPKPGILFKDITPVLAHPAARKQIVDSIVDFYKSTRIDAVAAVEARGFIFGALIAAALDVPFIPIRKSGRLPFKTIREDYALEYGTASLEIHEDALKPGWRVLLHDDLLATGGTAAAAGSLIGKLKGQIAGLSFIINLAFLNGEKELSNRFSLKPHYLISFS